MYSKITLTMWILYGLPGNLLSIQCGIRNWEDHDNIAYHFSNDRKNREDASYTCTACGGSLATDGNIDTHKFLVDSIKTKAIKGPLWIGLQLFTKYNWTSPIIPYDENQLSIIANDNHGLCVVSNGGLLEYSSCNESHLIICQRYNPLDGTWTELDGHYYKRMFPDTFNNAHITCGLQNNSYLTTFVGVERSVHIDPFWFGVSRYAWDDKTPLFWQKWNTVANIDSQDCVTLSGRNWMNHNCSSNFHFICQREYSYSTPKHKTTSKSITTIGHSETTQSSTSYSTVEIQNTQSTFRYDTTSAPYEEKETYPSVQTSDFVPQSQVMETVLTSTTNVYLTPINDKRIQTLSTPILIGSIAGAVVLLILVIVLVVVFYRRSKRQQTENRKGDYDAAYEIAYTPNTEDRTRNSDSSLTDDEKLAQLRDRDSRVVIDSNVPDSEKIKPYLVTTIVDGHGEGQPSRQSKVVSSIEDRVEYDNNNLDDLIVTVNDLYQSSVTDPNKADTRPGKTDYDYAERPPYRSQLSPGNVFINSAYDGEAEGGAGNHNQDAQIHYADIAFSTETLNKENTYADIDDFAPSVVTSDAEVPTTAGTDPRANTPDIANNDPDFGNQAGKMKAIPVYAEVDANKMDTNENEIIDERKDAHDFEEDVNDMIVTDNDLYDFNN